MELRRVLRRLVRSPGYVIVGCGVIASSVALAITVVGLARRALIEAVP